MWNAVEAAVEQIEPVVSSYKATIGVVDVLNGEVKLLLQSTVAGVNLSDTGLHDIVERTIRSEVPEIEKITFTEEGNMTNTSEQTINIDYDMPGPKELSCFLTLDRPLTDGGSQYFEHIADADADNLPAVSALLGIPGIGSVLVRSHVVIISRFEGEWEDIVPEALKVLRDALGETGVAGAPVKYEMNDEEQTLLAKVQAIVDADINPGLASHNGFINLVRLEKTTLFVTMGGGCQGCSSAAFTLSAQVAVMIKNAVAEIEDVRDITNHDEGLTPFYS